MEQVCDQPSSQQRSAASGWGNKQQHKRWKRSPFFGKIIEAKKKFIDSLIGKFTGKGKGRRRRPGRRPQRRPQVQAAQRQAASGGCRTVPKQMCSTQMQQKCTMK